MLSNHRFRGRTRLAWTTFIHSSYSELVFATLNQSIDLALYLLSHFFDFFHCKNFSFNPLSHILFFLFNDIMGNRSSTIRLWWCPCKVCMVWTPVKDIRLSTWIWLIPRILHQDVIALHFARVGHSNLICCNNSESVFVSLCEVLNLYLLRTSVISACTGGPGGVAGGGVHTLNNILLDRSTTVILRWSPVNHTVVVENIGDSTALWWCWLIHDININEFLAASLCIFHYHFVFSGLFTCGINKIQLNSITVNSEIGILTHHFS